MKGFILRLAYICILTRRMPTAGCGCAPGLLKLFCKKKKKKEKIFCRKGQSESSSSSGKSKAGFLGDVFHGPCLYLCGPYHTVLLYCMILLLVSHYTLTQMDDLMPTDKLSPMGLAVMSQLGSLATSGIVYVIWYL